MELMPHKRQAPFQKINNGYADTVSPKMENAVICSDSMVNRLQMKQFSSHIHGVKFI